MKIGTSSFLLKYLLSNQLVCIDASVNAIVDLSLFVGKALPYLRLGFRKLAYVTLLSHKRTICTFFAVDIGLCRARNGVSGVQCPIQVTQGKAYGLNDYFLKVKEFPARCRNGSSDVPIAV